MRLRSSESSQLLLAVGLAFGVRVASVLVFHNHQVSDSIMYDQLARMLAASGTYTFGGHMSAWWPVGYPAILSVVYRAFGPVVAAGLALNVFAGTATVALTVLSARRINPRAGFIAGITMALLPSHVFATNLLTTETMCTLLWLGAALALWPPIRPGSAAVGGLLLAAAALVRPIVLGFAPVWLLAAFFLTRPRRTALRAVAVCGATLCLGLSPWAFRNWRLFGTPVMVSTNGGFILWVGNNPLASGRYLLSNGVHSFAYAQNDPEVPRDRDEVAQDEAYRRRALIFVEASPGAVLRLIPAKLRYLWATDNDSASWLAEGLGITREADPLEYFALQGSALVAYWMVMATLFWSLIREAVGAQIGRAWLLVIPPLVVTAVHLASFGDDRFHFPMMPFIVAFSACGLAPIVFRESGQGERAAA